MDDNPDNAAPGTPADPATVFTALAGILYQGADTTEVCEAICVAATPTVPGCDHASVLMRRKNDYVTVAASDQIARQVDFLERTTGDGPCLDAIEGEAPQVEPDLTTSTSWPRLAPRVMAETPVRGAMGFRILVDHLKVAVGTPLLTRGVKELGADERLFARLRVPGRDDVALTADAGRTAIELASPDGEAALETDAAARVLLLWGRRPADPSRICSQAGPDTLGRLRRPLSGY